MVWVCQSGVWLVLVNIVISYCVSVGSSYVIGSEGINLTRDGQEVLELRIDIQQQSRVFNLELEERSARVWWLLRYSTFNFLRSSSIGVVFTLMLL